MTKQLLLIRHAKSSWAYPELRDFERELNQRGLANAPEMGARLRKRSLIPDAMLISPARRTIMTAELIAQETGVPATAMRFDDRLYLANPATMLATIRESDPKTELLAVIAHNPGITDLANLLAGYCIDNMPTCSVALLDLNTDVWGDAGKEPARLIDFDYPKCER